MARIFTLPAGRIGKFVVLAVVALIFMGAASQAGKFEDAQKNETSSFLPEDAESVQALKAVEQYPGGELAPAVVVFERPSGLTEADRRADRGDRRQAQRRPRAARARGPAADLLGERQGRDHHPAGRAGRGPGGEVRGCGAVDPRQGRRPRGRARRQGHGRRRLQPRRDQDLRQHQRQPAAGGGGDRADPAGHHLPLADLLGDPVLLGAAGGGGLARLRLPAGRGGRDDQRAVRRHPARAGVRRRHRLRAAARVPLPRGAAAPRGQARGDADRADERGPGDPGLGADRDRGVADAEHRRGQRHGRARAGRGDGRRPGDDLDADDPAGAAGDLRAARLLVAVPGHDPALRPGGRRRDERVLAPGRRPRRHAGRASSGSAARSCWRCSRSTSSTSTPG